ncbi:hypothetical protein RvY_14887 [Ramazzottius varieornatus]|uniref:Uncharacterized protein n=1 Tax=Ramazzottius varieornatus TaxID=947166 RepID=A0A1D1VUK3_RAMVA|nr:hypothetical protein RvY_14887 [Ramazzottius varieornatus]
MENHRQELSCLPRPQLTARLDEDQKICWGIITDLNRRLSRFRRLSLVSRKPLRSTLPPINEQEPGSNAVTQTQVTPYELPSHILGPVLRWIFNHLDFFNEDYVVDVLNELSWQNRFAFQMQAFLNEFKDFDYEDICKLALFFLRFSYKVSDKQQKVPLEPVEPGEVDEWLRNLTPEEFANRRIQFNDVFEALQACMRDKRNQVGQENAHFDIVKAQGQGRDASADEDYMNCYLSALDVHNKTKEWNQLLYGMRKESQISEKKLQLTARTASLHDKNQKLKSIIKVQLSNKEDRKFVYPPWWSRMDDVAEVLLKEIGQLDRQAGALAARQRLLPWHRHLTDTRGTNHGLPKSRSWTGVTTSR